MNTLSKVLIYSNPIGWGIGTGVLTAVVIHNVSKDVKKTNKILYEDD